MPKSTSDGNLVRLAIVSNLDPDALTKLLPPAIIGRFPPVTVEMKSIFPPVRKIPKWLAKRKTGTWCGRTKRARRLKLEVRGLLIHKVPEAKFLEDSPTGKLGVREKMRAAFVSDPDDTERVRGV